MSFEIRKTAPVYPEEPYNWSAASKFQCTWYAYYRALECGFTAPCYWDRATRQGSYTNAKLWLENFREPWQVKGPDYSPVAGDIAVFDGTYGHVAFIEKVSKGIRTVSDYNRVASETFAVDSWAEGTDFKGVGPLLGFLHFPNNTVETVARDENVDQIETTDPTLRVRTAPNRQAEIFCHVQTGYYNILSTVPATAEDQAAVEGLTEWYEIDKGKYCANITTVKLPATGTDILKEIERYINAMRQKTEGLVGENQELKGRLDQIESIAHYKKETL